MKGKVPLSAADADLRAVERMMAAAGQGQRWRVLPTWESEDGEGACAAVFPGWLMRRMLRSELLGL